MDTSTIFDGIYRERWKQIPWRFVSLVEGILQVAIARFLKHQLSGIHLEGSVTKKIYLQQYPNIYHEHSTRNYNDYQPLTSADFLPFLE